MKPLILSLDTSCYTTSCALVDAEGNAVVDLRSPLRVKPGERGLRQAEAVFAHLTQLPDLLESTLASTSAAFGGPAARVVAIAASTRPRPPLGSYLPVFRVGEGFGRTLAAAWRVPLVAVSHQEGHLAAGWEAGMPDRLLALHVSGGTTELMRLEAPCPWRISSLGASLDLHAGQFLDRVGVAMGLPFPAGAELDAMAAGITSGDGQGEGGPSLPVTVKGYCPSFAGPEAAAYRLLQAGVPFAQVARAALSCVAKALEKMILQALEAGEPREVLVVGGVAASPGLRARLHHRLAHPAVGVRLYFPEPRLCTDNAVGVGRWAWHRLRADIKDLSGPA